MGHLGSINGDGDLYNGTTPIGRVAYRIDAWRDESGKHAAGPIQADDDILTRAWQVDLLTLLVRDGSPIMLFISDYETGSGEATVIISGPVPGLD